MNMSHCFSISVDPWLTWNLSGVELGEQKETVKNSGKRVLRDSFPKIYPGDQDLKASSPQKYKGRVQVCFVYYHVPSLDERLPVRGVSLLCVAKSMEVKMKTVVICSLMKFGWVGMKWWLEKLWNQWDFFFGGAGGWKHLTRVYKSSKEVEEKLKIGRKCW